MKKALIIGLSLIMLMALACGGGKSRKGNLKISKDKTFGRATGYATIYYNDKALAKDRAIDVAKRNLVKKILGDTIKGTATMKNYQLVSTIVTSKSFGLVKNDRIVDEKTSGNYYEVTIEGNVSPAAVEDAINAAINSYGKPKFLILVKETIRGARKPLGETITGTELMNTMGNLGFDFVDAEMLKTMIRKDRRSMEMAWRGNIGNPNVQKLLLETSGAEVVLIGSMKLVDQTRAAGGAYGGMQGLKSIAANLRLKAVDVYTGRVLGAVNSRQYGAHLNRESASQAAIKRTVSNRDVLGSKGTGKGDFIQQVLNKFIKASNNREIDLYATGLNNFRDRTMFRNKLQQAVRGVNKVYDKGRRKGQYRILTVYFAGKTNDFLTELSNKGEKFGFSVEVKENFPNRGIIAVQKK